MSMARELGGVLAIGGLGSVAVARLSGRLDATLAAAGVGSGARPGLVDALLGARKDEVRRLVLTAIGPERTLALGDTLASTATTSFLASTRLVLDLAAALLLVAAVACWRLLSTEP